MSAQPLVLIVDDDPVVVLTLEALLSQENYELAVARDGHSALRLARNMPPDVILLDVMMPDMDGFDVCRRLRADPLLGEVPVVMITALDEREARLEGLRAGADDFLLKPVDRLELQARLRTITRLNRYQRLLAERERLSWVLEQSPDGYVLLDSMGRIVRANPRAQLYLGLVEDAGADLFLDVVDRQYRREPESAWADWPEPGAAPRYLVRAETTTATAFWLGVALLQPRGSSVERIVQLRDVTARILTHQDMRAFHSLISHKLRTPLFGLLGGLDMLADPDMELSAAEMREMATAAHEGAERLQQALQGIMAYIGAPVLCGDSGGFALVALPGRVAETAAALDLGGVSVHLAPGVEAVRVAFSPRALDLVLLELLENARKFHPTCTPRVQVRAALGAAGTVRLTVEDDGLSLSPEQIAQAFLPYVQGEKYFTGEAAGLGLGLAQVASLVWGVGGTARLYNRAEGSGVIVELTLPGQGG